MSIVKAIGHGLAIGLCIVGLIVLGLREFAARTEPENKVRSAQEVKK